MNRVTKSSLWWYFALLVSTLLGFPATAHEETALEELILSDGEFASQLMRSSGVAVPTFLGCNRAVGKEPTLPLVCFHENITSRIELISPSALNIFALVEKIPTIGWWASALQEDELSLISWSVEPRYFWHQRKLDQSILCVIGKPKKPKNSEFFAAECLRTFPDSSLSDEGRTLRISFEDLGVFEIFGNISSRDELEFRVFVTFFAMNVGSL